MIRRCLQGKRILCLKRIFLPSLRAKRSNPEHIFMRKSIWIASLRSQRQTVVKILNSIRLPWRRVFAFFFFMASVNGVYAATLTTLDGESISFDALKGKWIFINYWASWCQPCLDEIKELNHFYKRHNANMALFAVNIDGLSLTKQQRLIQKLHIRYPSLRHNPANILHLGDASAVPVTFVLNQRGQLIDTLWGPQTALSLSQIMKPAINHAAIASPPANSHVE